MKQRRRFPYQRRTRGSENLDEGQDSFLDVVSNLVGILIILVMIAGARVHDAASETALADDSARSESEEQETQATDREEYVAAVESLAQARADLEKTRRETEEFNERYSMVERQADGAEEEYRALLASAAEMDAAFKAEAQSREDSEKIAFDLKSEIFEKEKKRDDLQREKEALEAARPRATVLENLPTPISQRVEDGKEGYFQLKNGRLAHVPLNEFAERMRLYFKNYRGDLTKNSIEEKIGPVDNFTFHYIVDVQSSRDADGINYALQLRYGECLPLNDEIGEPVDVALASKESKFCRSLLKYNRQETTITIFVYPDSFQYLRDIKKLLFSLKYQMALRPLPDGVPIAISPHGTASSTY